MSVDDQHPPALTEFRVGDWKVQPASDELFRNDKVVQVEPKVMALLVYLAERADQVVSREQLFTALWPGVVVGDDTLTQVVIKLRKALGDDAKAPRYVQTIPKKGYRLLEPVQPEPESPIPFRTKATSPRTHSRLAVIFASMLAIGLAVYLTWHFPTREPEVVVTQMTPSSRADERPTISVTPFTAIGDPTDQIHIAQGLTLDLVTDLSKLSGLWVIGSRTILGQHTKEAETTHARYQVSGDVQLSSEQIRIYVRLLDTETNRQLWSERYHRHVGDLFNVQDEISRQIASALSLKVSETERLRLARRYTRNFEAYEQFLRGQALLLVRQKPENDRARESYRRAIALDPSFARAYAGLALTFAADYRNQWTKDTDGALARAREMAKTALQIDPDIPEVYWVLAYVSTQQRDHTKALALLAQAIALDQSFADAYALMGGINTYVGNPAETVGLLRTAIRLNPDAGYLYFLLLGRAYYYLGDWEQALVNLNEALARNPANLEAHVYMVAVEESSGEHDAAAWEAEEVRSLQPDFAARAWLETYPMTDQAQQEQLVSTLSGVGL